MIDGKCLCGKITYTLKSDLLFMYNCHCVECRAFSGSSLACNAMITAADFELHDNENQLKSFETAGGIRKFCNHCGSPIYSHQKGFEEFPALHVGSIINPPEKAVDANTWVSEKCPWVVLSQDIPSHEEHLD